MKVVAFVKGARAVACLEALVKEKNNQVSLIVAQPGEGTSWFAAISELAQENNIELICPEDPHAESVIARLEQETADVFLLLGYGIIVKKSIIELPRLMVVNLHGGRLPEMRGSSPLNWALIKGATEFTLSVIKVDTGVDTGDVLLERTFPIGELETIGELHTIANQAFPEMLVEVLNRLESGTLTPRTQELERASYFPLRFPEDGYIVWDMYTAEEVFNRVRALTKPYPPAFTYLEGRKVELLSAQPTDSDCFGEPGRVYRKTKQGVLVCARDKCLWIKEAVFSDDHSCALSAMERYSMFATARAMVKRLAEKGEL